jgi:hypothetical protein
METRARSEEGRSGEVKKSRYVLASALLLTACPAVEKVDEPAGGDGVPCAVQATLTTYCALPACHSGIQAPNLSEGNTADAIQGTATNGQRYVVFGDVENSRLAQIMLPSTPGNMPPVGNPKPPAEEVAVIFGWIANAPFPEAESDGACTAGTTTATTMMTASESGSSSGPGEPVLCSLDTIDPSADVGAAVDAGDTATQIPTVVGDALVASCGCHYTDMLPMEYGAAYGGNQGLSTLADFQDTWAGVLPMNTGQPAYEAIAQRINGTLAMPPTVCAPEDPAADNPTMTQADYDLLMHWLGMGAPDGASYTPP